ncbi:MAG TPA: TRAP transporter small permease [Methylomirabilota bacterium]|nr:TRAP transporter small permease [Methylomirabilota bacterium]
MGPDAPFGRWGRRLYEGLGHLGGLILGVMTLAVFTQVLLRWLGRVGIEGLDEVPRYLFVWLVMIGAAAAMYRGQHTTLEFFILRLPRRGRALAHVLTTAGAILLFLSLLRSSLVLVPNSQLQTSAGLNLPLGYVYAAMPVGAFLMLLPLAWRLGRALRDLWQKPS